MMRKNEEEVRNCTHQKDAGLHSIFCKSERVETFRPGEEKKKKTHPLVGVTFYCHT